jgi:hypothetical protein
MVKSEKNTALATFLALTMGMGACGSKIEGNIDWGDLPDRDVAITEEISSSDLPRVNPDNFIPERDWASESDYGLDIYPSSDTYPGQDTHGAEDLPNAEDYYDTTPDLENPYDAGSQLEIIAKTCKNQCPSYSINVPYSTNISLGETEDPNNPLSLKLSEYMPAGSEGGIIGYQVLGDNGEVLENHFDSPDGNYIVHTTKSKTIRGAVMDAYGKITPAAQTITLTSQQ